MKSYVLKTLAANWRDLLAFLVFGIGLAALKIGLDSTASLFTGSRLSLVLMDVAGYLQGISRFYGAAFCATFLWMLLWPTPNTLNHDGGAFLRGWNSLGDSGKFWAFLALILGALIAAAICFSVGAAA